MEFQFGKCRLVRRCVPKSHAECPGIPKFPGDLGGILWKFVVACRCQHAGTKCRRESQAVVTEKLLTLLASGSLSGRGALGVVPRHHPRRLIPAAPNRSDLSIHWYSGITACRASVRRAARVGPETSDV